MVKPPTFPGICSALRLRNAALCAGIVGFAAITTASPAQADTNVSQDLQTLDCAWWDYVTQYAFEDFAIFLDAGNDAPIAELKYRLDYQHYDPFSAGRAMLDVLIAGIHAGDGIAVTQQNVAMLCQTFPAEAVDPDNIFAPMLGETL